MLRSNDLIWSFVINNYLLGRDPFPFDLLHWNSDSTRMPATMHSFYLRKMYMKNLLRVPGGITLAGVPIDLAKSNVPTYFVSAIEDHIAPWKTTYQGPLVIGGRSRFVLSGSGHIAGMINPPSAKKYGYWTNDKLPESAEAWLEGAKQHEGSWWTHWRVARPRSARRSARPGQNNPGDRAAPTTPLRADGTTLRYNAR
jgi:polyhydroxyalkanoate synthase